MNNKKFLEDSNVIALITWLRKISKDEKPFSHSYCIETSKEQWSCSSLFNAKEKYNWAFTYYDSIKNEQKSGSTFDQNEETLNYLSSNLKKSINEKNLNECKKICPMILDWGGVLGSDSKGNKKILGDLGDELCTYLLETKAFFESDNLNLARSYKISINNIDKKNNNEFRIYKDLFFIV